MLHSEHIKKLLPGISYDEIGKLIKFFNVLRKSLYTKNEQSIKIVRFIDSISVGNMRDALRMFNNFIISGNTNIKEIFDKFDFQGSYQIAYHQLIKSIMLGEHRYYMQDRSQIANLFDIDTTLTESHFLLLKILDFLKQRINKKSNIGRGYIEIDILISEADTVFISRDAILDSLLKLANFNLVEFDNQSKKDVRNATYVKITHSGIYYLDNLVYENIYLDMVAMDTPISDDVILEHIRKRATYTDIANRLERTKHFVDYLYQSEMNELRGHPEYLSNDFAKTLFGDKIKEAFISSETAIRRRIESRKADTGDYDV